MKWILFFLILVPLAHAHQSSLTPSGNEIYWMNPNIYVAIKPRNNDMSSNQAEKIILNSINQWNQASRAKVKPGASSENEIKFVSNFPYGSAVLGVTEISYNNSGNIRKASILLNDDYFFHSEPGFFSPGQIYLGDVISHEIGHLLGLSHSEVLNSTMFYSSFSGQNSLAQDDRSGVKNKYNTDGGTIYGFVKGGDSIGVLGAHVQAISRNTGEAVGAFSDERGFFILGGLDLDDTYYLYVSPLKNSGALPSYFSNAQDRFCPGQYLGSFFTACGQQNDGKPLGINLTKQTPSLNVGTVSISCSLRSDELYNLEKLQTRFDPITIYDYRIDEKSEKAFVGWFWKLKNDDWTIWDEFIVDMRDFRASIGDSLKIGLVSYPLGTQLEYEMKIFQEDNLNIPLVSKSMTQSILSRTYQPDLSASIFLSSDVNQNLFRIKVRAKRLLYVAETFPAAMKFTSDDHLPYLITMGLYQNSNSQTKPLMDNQHSLSDNELCLEGPFTFPVAKSSMSLGDSSSSSEEATQAAASCGVIDNPPSDKGGGGTMIAILLGFLFPWLLHSLAQSQKKFLS